MTIDELKNEKVAMFVSGGLDSRTITKKLVDLGIDVVCFTADLGQPDESDIRAIRKRMAPCGANTVIVDLKRSMAEACDATKYSPAPTPGGRSMYALPRPPRVSNRSCSSENSICGTP